MDLAITISAVCIIFSAYLVRGIAGFGSGLIAVPLLSLFFPLTQVVPLVVFLDYIGSASQGLKNRERIAWREQLPLIPFTLIGVGLGLFVLKVMTTLVLRKTLGVFVIAYALYQWLPVPALQGSRIFAVPLGFLGGFVGTLFGTGGPFYVIYLTLRGLDKTAFRATFATNFLIDGAFRLTAYASVGLFQPDVLMALLAALPIAGIGLYVGGRIHTGLSQELFVRFISLLLVAGGFGLLMKS
ncbi:MAG: sulfite exporter TauE/SafE family protein [bacterium]|nr:sulfite exporter TauE/SafE family protein [bacterium]